jgi:hypothetical protein
MGPAQKDMFESLSTRLQDVFKSLRGESRLTEETVDAALREIRLALLEADVNFRVVKAFVDRVRVKAVGEDVLRSLTPGQHVVRIVRDEMLACSASARWSLIDDSFAASRADAWPAGFGQDDVVGQAGEVAAEARAPPDGRVDRRAAAGSHQAVVGAG